MFQSFHSRLGCFGYFRLRAKGKTTNVYEREQIIAKGGNDSGCELFNYDNDKNSFTATMDADIMSTVLECQPFEMNIWNVEMLKSLYKLALAIIIVE